MHQKHTLLHIIGTKGVGPTSNREEKKNFFLCDLTTENSYIFLLMSTGKLTHALTEIMEG